MTSNSSQITAIHKNRRSPNLFNVLISGRKPLSIPAELVLKFNLSVGRVLASQELLLLEQSTNLSLATSTAFNFLSFRSRSTREIRDYLKRKNYTSEVQDQVIAKLTSLGYLNDKQFASLWIESRLKNKPKSKKLIALELKQKGVSQVDIDSQLNQVEETDTQAAQKLISQKVSRWDSLNSDEKRKKITNFLTARGFNWDTIREVLNSLAESDKISS